MRPCIALREPAHYVRTFPSSGWWKKSSADCGVSSNVERNAIPALDHGPYARVISFLATSIQKETDPGSKNQRIFSPTTSTGFLITPYTGKRNVRAK